MNTFTILHLISVITVFSDDVISARSFDISHGFKYVYKDIKYKNGIDHHTYLYFKEKNLGDTSKYSISPDGKFAIFQIASTSEIFFFDVTRNELYKFVNEHVGLVRAFEWDMPSMNVRIILDKDGKERIMSF